MMAAAANDGLSETSMAALLKAGLQGATATIAKIPGVSADRIPAYATAIRDGNVKAYHMVRKLHYNI